MLTVIHEYFLLTCLLFIFAAVNLEFFITAAAADLIRRNRCELKLVADYAFYKEIGNNNYANAARYLINLIERVNSIFLPVDWGLDINGDQLTNLGFAISEIKIFENSSGNSSPTHFNSIIQYDVSPIEMLKSFSAEEGTNSSCLTILVTAKSLQFGTLGMSNIGDPGKRGICASNRVDGTFTNTALISVRRKSDLMITRVVDLILAHELGHAWGSLHDDKMEDEECVPTNSRDGRFVMWDSANTGYDKNNDQFSPCSIRSIHRMLYSLAHRCFVEEKRALCGNGLLEEGEQCDSGAQLTNSGAGGDNCCTRKCRFRQGASCSPRHSECCSRNCTFLSADFVCNVRSNDSCKAEAKCSGHNDKCPEPEALEDGTDCIDEGKCSGGECVSFCRTISPDLGPCLCEEASVACRRCCRSATTGICSPVTPERWLPDAAMCIHGQCLRRVCEKESTDSGPIWRFFESFKGSENRNFLADYIVFIVVIVSLLIWCPCGALIVYKDREKQRELYDRRMAAALQNGNNFSGASSRQRTDPSSTNSLVRRSHSINEASAGRTVASRRIRASNSEAGLFRLNPVGEAEAATNSGKSAANIRGRVCRTRLRQRNSNNNKNGRQANGHGGSIETNL